MYIYSHLSIYMYMNGVAGAGDADVPAAAAREAGGGRDPQGAGQHPLQGWQGLLSLSLSLSLPLSLSRCISLSLHIYIHLSIYIYIYTYIYIYIYIYR